MLRGKNHALLLTHCHPLVFEIEMALVWTSVDESTHLSEKMPVSDVDYPVDC